MTGRRVDPFAYAADKLDPPPRSHTVDPVAWVADRTGEHLWSKQREIAASVVDNRYTAVKSCHGAGKSFLAARIAAWWIDSHPEGEAFVVSTAPTFPQVRAILWKELRRAHRKANLAGRINQTEWWLDDELIAFGRKPADTDPGAFQGIHARYVLVIIDEACAVHATGLWDAIDSLVTNDDSRVLAIGNPDDPAAHFAEVCAPGSGWNVIRISAFDTPNLTSEEIPETLRPLLVSRTWVDERASRWGVGSPRYVSKVTGEFPDVGDDTLIEPRWINEAQLRELPPLGDRALGVDVARFGGDETCIYVRQGPVVRLVGQAHKQDTMATAGMVKLEVEATRPYTPANIDEVGVGAGVLDRLLEQGLPVTGRNGGSRPNDTEHFVNARAEWYWGLRKRFEAGDVDIDPEDDVLAAQLGAVKYGINSRGQIYIESKDDMRARGLPSPDRADTVMYAFIPPSALFDVATHTAGQRPITEGLLTAGF